MNIVNRFRPARQFHCRPLVGKTAPFGYEAIVRAANGTHNYQPAVDLVAAFSEMNAKGRELWKSLTGTTGTSEALPSMSLATTVKSGRSYSNAQVIRMTACNLLSVSLKSSKG